MAGAFAVNAFTVRELALACRELDATLVHFSTNYVFGQDEARREPYRETDAPGPISAYGVSKLAGEYFPLALVRQEPRDPYVRPVRSRGEGDFTLELHRKAARPRPRGEKLRVVDDQACTPTSAADLAEGALRLLQAKASGLYHFTNEGACTWHEYACAALRLAKTAAPVEAVTSDTFAAPARRPTYSVLACAGYDSKHFPPRAAGKRRSRATWPREDEATARVINIQVLTCFGPIYEKCENFLAILRLVH